MRIDSNEWRSYNNEWRNYNPNENWLVYHYI